jgi:hypothetical protein
MTQPTDPITITLQFQQWNVVLTALGDAPWRHADPVIREIGQQAAQVTQAIQQPAAQTTAAEPVKPNGAGDHASTA